MSLNCFFIFDDSAFLVNVWIYRKREMHLRSIDLSPSFNCGDITIDMSPTSLLYCAQNNSQSLSEMIGMHLLSASHICLILTL